MLKRKNIILDNWFYIIAFIIPLIIAISFCFVEGIWFTGSGNIATGDMAIQLIPIAYELWDKFHLHESFSFTWHIMDGLDFGSLIGYMISPFTLIMLLIPRKWIPDYIQLIMLVKWSLVSLSMTFFFYNSKYNKVTECRKLVSLFLGLAYALSNGLMSYIIYIQFMDVMICFPVLLLLVEKMVDKKTWKLYCMVLAFIIFSNSYIAFQICVFLVVWFVLNIIDDDVTEKKRKTIIFLGSSVLAGFSNCAFVFDSLTGAAGRLEMDYSSQLEYFRQGMINMPYDIINKLFVFNDILGPTDKLPNIYFSVSAAVIILLFPFIKMDNRKKVFIIIIAILLTAGFFVGYVNLFWHIFIPPNGVYNRFMYLFIFFMLFIALLVIGQLSDVSILKIIISMVFAIGLFIYTFFNIKLFDNEIMYILTMMIVFFMFVMLIFYRKNSLTTKQIIIIITLCGISELCINSYDNFIYCINDSYYGEKGYVDKVCNMLDNVELKSGERISAATLTPNIGMIAGKNADSGFISSVNVNDYNLHKNLGMGIIGNTEFLTRGASPLVNLIFNIRYGLDDGEAAFSDATLEAKESDYKLYKINRLAGLGYMTDENIKDWNTETGNCFEIQNDFVSKAVDEDDIFDCVDVNLRCQDFLGEEYNRNNTSVKGDYTYDLKGRYGDEYDAKMFDFTADKDMDLYMKYSCGKRFDLVIYVDDKEIHRDTKPFQQCTYHIGNVKKGQKVSIIAIPLSVIKVDEEYQIGLSFADFNNEVYDRVYEKLSNNIYDIEDERSDYICGEIDADASGIMMTSVPAVDGFKVYVDGDEVDYNHIANTFIGVPLQKGKHKVEFVYIKDKNMMGIIVSVFSVIVFIILCLKDGRFINKGNAIEEKMV